MIEYFDNNDIIKTKVLRDIKNIGALGDYIYARRISKCIFSPYNLDFYRDYVTFIDYSLNWDETPQGSRFWRNICY